MMRLSIAVTAAIRHAAAELSPRPDEFPLRRRGFPELLGNLVAGDPAAPRFNGSLALDRPTRGACSPALRLVLCANRAAALPDMRNAAVQGLLNFGSSNDKTRQFHPNVRHGT